MNLRGTVKGYRELGPSCCLDFFEMFFSCGLPPDFAYGQRKISATHVVSKVTYVDTSPY